jgi:hypothetical protein
MYAIEAACFGLLIDICCMSCRHAVLQHAAQHALPHLFMCQHWWRPKRVAAGDAATAPAGQHTQTHEQCHSNSVSAAGMTHDALQAADHCINDLVSCYISLVQKHHPAHKPDSSSEHVLAELGFRDAS